MALNLRVSAALLCSVGILTTWSMCCCGHLEKMTMSSRYTKENCRFTKDSNTSIVHWNVLGFTHCAKLILFYHSLPRQFPFVNTHYQYLMWNICCFSQCVDTFLHTRYEMRVSFCHCVRLSVVNTEPQCSVFPWCKVDDCCSFSLRWFYKFLFDCFVNFDLFELPFLRACTIWRQVSRVDFITKEFKTAFVTLIRPEWPSHISRACTAYLRAHHGTLSTCWMTWLFPASPARAVGKLH